MNTNFIIIKLLLFIARTLATNGESIAMKHELYDLQCEVQKEMEALNEN